MSFTSLFSFQKKITQIRIFDIEIIIMSAENAEKVNAYSEPPPPYTSAPPQAPAYATPGQYGVNVAACRQMFKGPAHPPPPGGVPVFPGAPGYFPTGSQTVVVTAPTSNQPGVSTVTVLTVEQCGPYPMQVTCPHCSAGVMSQTTALPGLLTFLLAGGLVCLGCWGGCCLIPCCIPECQDVEHRCPNCKQHLGTFRRINI